MSFVHIFCKYGGDFIIENNKMVNYDGGTSALILVETTCSFKKLYAKMYEVTGWNPRTDVISMWTRLEIAAGWWEFPCIISDETLEGPLALVTKGLAKVLELYLKRESLVGKALLEVDERNTIPTGGFREVDGGHGRNSEANARAAMETDIRANMGTNAETASVEVVMEDNLELNVEDNIQRRIVLMDEPSEDPDEKSSCGEERDEPNMQKIDDGEGAVDKSSKISILCWHDCRFEREHGSIVNHHGGESISSSIDSTSSFQVLMTKLYELMGWNPANYSILVWMKVQTMPGVYHYVEVKNDENLAASFNLVLTGKVFVLEFFMERSSSWHRGEGTMESNVLGRSAEVTELLSQVQGNQNVGDDDNLQKNVPKNLKRKISQVAGTGLSTRNAIELQATETQSSSDNDMMANKCDGNGNFGSVAGERLANDRNKDLRKASMDNYATADDIYVGKTFSNKEALERHLLRYSIKRHVQFDVIESTDLVYDVKCINNECPWGVYASYSAPIHNFEIRRYDGDHECASSSARYDSRECTSRFIYNTIMPMVKTEFTLTLNKIWNIFKDKYRMDISMTVAREARFQAYKAVFGGLDESYDFLHKFLNEVKETNPKSMHVLCGEQVGDKRMFKSVFWAFGPSINGFRYCRPVICLDGICLEGKDPSYLFMASTLDGDKGLFPLAFAIVESESETTWEWFLTCLDQFVVCGMKPLTFISDCHEDLIGAIQNRFPPPHYFHRFCLKHLPARFKMFDYQDFSETVRGCAMKLEIRDFDKEFNEIDLMSEKLKKN
ncbi:hypothetical protein H6P81_009263 [Aristolochia fimbriata]|uniref:MULE transposase domain-containing protein n=1 Tax=Aristolochia fimbriata TaxID=158543 RepID=A0AAV7EPW4_ARIFI|nr:hypothetical protein H6P81_009263 [Aristolochia fimbriata]